MRLSFLKNKIKTNHETIRHFNYDVDGTKLSFSLRTDVKNQLKNFEQILAEAIEDVREEMAK